MRLRLFPAPRQDECTPFTLPQNGEGFARLLHTTRGIQPAEIEIKKSRIASLVNPITGKVYISYRIPDRNLLKRYLRFSCKRDSSLVRFVENVFVIPTFSAGPEEALVKAILRQIVRAGHAKRLISDLIRRFGPARKGLYGFPSLSALRSAKRSDYAGLGLGMKTDRIVDCINRDPEIWQHEPESLHGVGPWTSAILRMDLNADYSFYPFDDKSGERIKEKCQIDLTTLAKSDPSLAGDVYVYAASYLETLT
jgi:hypothetical protein